MAQFNKYYYIADAILLDYDNNNTYNLNNSLNALRIIKDYENNVFPILEANFNLKNEEYQKIRDNNVKIKISLYKRTVNSEEDSLVNETIGEEYSVFENVIFELVNKNFVIYDDNTLEDNTLSQINITCALFSTDHLILNKTMINGNYLDCRIIDVLSLINNVNKSVLYIEKPDNENKYEQIIVPPINLTSFPNYLQEYYSIYRDGLRIFFDYDNYFLLNDEITLSTPKTNTEYINVILDLIDSDALNTQYPFDYGYKGTNSNYYYIKTNIRNFKLSDKNYANNEIFGSNKIILSMDENLNINRTEVEVENKIVNKTKLYYNKINDKFLEYNEDSNNIKAIFNFKNLDMDTFRCNKRFLCTYLGEQYIFKVQKVIFELVKDDSSGVFESKGMCIFEEN